LYNIFILKIIDFSNKKNLPPKYYIVDLIHEPGKLMAVNSVDANQYVKL
jgi:hypothetical protein